MAICVVGSVALDDLKSPKGERKNLLGGAALHFSNAASLYSDVNLVGVVGDDFPSEGYDLFKAKNVNTEGLEIIKGGKTFHWDGYYLDDMNEAHTNDTLLGVFADFDPKIPESYKNSDLLFLGNIDPVIQLNVKKSMGNVTTMLDTMNFWISSKKSDLLKVIKEIDFLLVNEGEAKQLTGKTMLLQAADELLDLGPKYVIVKLGAYGVFIKSKDFFYSLPAFPVTELVDPTGAGDSFAGGFIGYLNYAKEINEKNLKLALAYGTITASYYVEGFGVEGLIDKNKENIEKRLKEFRRYITLPDN